ncbi:aldehyde dehydrogenase family protein [Nitratireductor pacificus]|uniref:Aldehyde dehydrogenase n=1 Tax=Nitratireductor pacificus pht-3B TaxID=391937 RepID=K2MB73_9HYPH|nr:aldehyde dehydrogenase family protein [Nitratireductor pacificus]EKF18110.1 aldehyde dehydrogenase [Nitratireductor pacificus pht-3B]
MTQDAKPFRNIIDGRSVAAAQSLPVHDPASGALVGQMPLGTAEDLDAAVAAARAAFPGWAATPDAERKAACNRIADVLEANIAGLAPLLTAEQGKPLGGLGSQWEIGGAAAWTRHTASIDLPMAVLQDDNEGRVEVHRKPIGVVGSITPWNFPVLIAAWHIIPAVRTGNCVVIKPSPNTPLSTIRFVELINEVLPAGVVNIVCGDNGIGAAMSAHPGIDKMVFTGSTGTGRKIMASAAETVKRLTLELGGNDAAIVLPDVDPQAIAEGLFWGAFINNGQTCACIKRLYVHDSIYDAVCEALAALAAAMPMGDGRQEGVALGPMQNEMQFERVKTLVEEAKAKGARALTGGAPAGGAGYFYPATIVADAEHGMRLVDEEQFGPALPVIRYTDIDAVIARANDNPNGLGGSIWSRDTARARELALRLECGTAWINKHGMIQPNAPFGGIKQSGVGVQFAEAGLMENTVGQTIIM